MLEVFTNSITLNLIGGRKIFHSIRTIYSSLKFETGSLHLKAYVELLRSFGPLVRFSPPGARWNRRLEMPGSGSARALCWALLPQTLVGDPSLDPAEESVVRLFFTGPSSSIRFKRKISLPSTRIELILLPHRSTIQIF